MKFILFIGFLVSGGLLQAAPTSLEDELDSLNLPLNEVPQGVQTEKLYAVQNRLIPLQRKSEITVGGGRGLSSGNFVTTHQLDLNYRFHLNERWHLNAMGNYMFNDLTATTRELYEQEGVVPDLAYIKYAAAVTAGVHLFYGKFRMTMNRVFYFDQYISVGPGFVTLNTATRPAIVADAGFSLWLGRFTVARLGIRDYFYKEQRVLSSSFVNNFVVHFDFGFAFGGQDAI